MNDKELAEKIEYGIKIIVSLGIVFGFFGGVWKYLGTYNYWDLKQLELILAIWGIGGLIFMYWMWKK